VSRTFFYEILARHASVLQVDTIFHISNVRDDITSESALCSYYVYLLFKCNVRKNALCEKCFELLTARSSAFPLTKCWRLHSTSANNSVCCHTASCVQDVRRTAEEWDWLRVERSGEGRERVQRASVRSCVVQ